MSKQYKYYSDNFAGNLHGLVTYLNQQYPERDIVTTQGAAGNTVYVWREEVDAGCTEHMPICPVCEANLAVLQANQQGVVKCWSCSALVQVDTVTRYRTTEVPKSPEGDVYSREVVEQAASKYLSTYSDVEPGDSSVYSIKQAVLMLKEKADSSVTLRLNVFGERKEFKNDVIVLAGKFGLEAKPVVGRSQPGQMAFEMSFKGSKEEKK